MILCIRSYLFMSVSRVPGDQRSIRRIKDHFLTSQRDGRCIIDEDVDTTEPAHQWITVGHSMGMDTSSLQIRRSLVHSLHFSHRPQWEGPFLQPAKYSIQWIALSIYSTFSISSAAVYMVPGSLAWGVAVFAATTIFAPSSRDYQYTINQSMTSSSSTFASLRAICLPIPRDAPVMRAVRPANLLKLSGTGKFKDQHATHPTLCISRLQSKYFTFWNEGLER